MGWKLIDSDNSNSGVQSDFGVRDDAENYRGLCVRLTFTFTASVMSAPPYVSVIGLTNDKLSTNACPDGILAAKVSGLCKGGNDLHNNGFGWLVFLHADKKVPASNKDKPRLSIVSKQFIHYNENVLPR